MYKINSTAITRSHSSLYLTLRKRPHFSAPTFPCASTIISFIACTRFGPCSFLLTRSFSLCRNPVEHPAAGRAASSLIGSPNEDRCQITWVATCLRQDCRSRGRGRTKRGESRALRLKPLINLSCQALGETVLPVLTTGSAVRKQGVAKSFVFHLLRSFFYLKT